MKGTLLKFALDFFYYAQERYRIKLARDAGKPAPWTQDRVLQEFRFCHVFREDDKTTQWFARQVRSQIEDPLQLVFATIAFRWFNRIETGQLITPWLLGRWNSNKVRAVLKGVQPVVTGAYMITSPPGLKKMEGIVHNIEQVQTSTLRLVAASTTLQQAHGFLRQVPYLGTFHSYEIVCDLYHTPVLAGAPDINTWCNPGPGCKRGLQWVADEPVLGKKMLPMMAELLRMAGYDEHWPDEWPRWDMRTVEHTLCEYDKWRRGHTGQRLKRRYAQLAR